MLFLLCDCYAFVHVCILLPCGHRLGKGCPLAFVCDVLLRVCYFAIGILGQGWYLIVSIPDLCPLSYFVFRLLEDIIFKLATSEIAMF